MVKNKNNDRGKSEVLTFAVKILKLLYIVLIIGIIFIGTRLIKEWGIFKFLGTLFKVASPLFIGFGIAWLFNPLVNMLEKKKIKRIFASIIVYVTFLIVAFIFIRLLIPTLYNQIINFIGTLPEIMNSVEGFIADLLGGLSGNSTIDVDSIISSVTSSMGSYVTNMVEHLPDFILSIMTSLFSGIGTLLISLMVGFFILFDFENLKKHFLNLFPHKDKKTVKSIMAKVGDELRKYVNGQLLAALIVFILSFLGFIIIGLKNPLLFGAICGIFDLIVFIGPWIAGIIAAIVGFTQAPVTGIMVIVVVIVVQQIENMAVRPIIFSKSNNLHPVTVIISVLVFGYFFGIWGILLSTPIIAVFKIAFIYINAKYQFIKTKEEDETEETL